MRLLAQRSPQEVPKDPAEWPHVTVLMSVYNEELVLPAKLNSLRDINYPREKLRCLIGSDASTDKSNHILQDFSGMASFTDVHIFSKRRGKPSVINNLAEIALQRYGKSPTHIFLLTDANVLLLPDTLRHLVRHFSRPEVAVVDSHMQAGGTDIFGISRSEQQYISGEVYLKHHEGRVWGTMIGPFGGCYALRSTHWTAVPPAFLVDDFFITMRALEQGGLAINDLDAVCTENATHDMWVEFRRKSRISAGNFQNLAVFAHLLWPPWKPLAFAFFSHKVIRWFGPFLIIGIFASGFVLCESTHWTQVAFWWLTGSILALPILDYVLQKIGINYLPLRSAGYFLVMNAALLHGFFKYLKGIKSNVWERTKRSPTDTA